VKKYIVFLALFLHGAPLLAQAGDAPFLSDEDIASIELTLPEDLPERLRESPAPPSAAPVRLREAPPGQTPPVYHLLILDRRACPSADLGNLGNRVLLYKFRHSTNGYLIAVYVSSGDDLGFPALPPRSRIVAHLMSVSRTTMRDYVRSSAFRRHITNSAITAGILRAL